MQFDATRFSRFDWYSCKRFCVAARRLFWNIKRLVHAVCHGCESCCRSAQCLVSSFAVASEFPLTMTPPAGRGHPLHLAASRSIGLVAGRSRPSCAPRETAAVVRAPCSPPPPPLGNQLRRGRGSAWHGDGPPRAASAWSSGSRRVSRGPERSRVSQLQRVVGDRGWLGAGGQPDAVETSRSYLSILLVPLYVGSVVLFVLCIQELPVPRLAAARC